MAPKKVTNSNAVQVANLRAKIAELELARKNRQPKTQKGNKRRRRNKMNPTRGIAGLSPAGRKFIECFMAGTGMRDMDEGLPDRFSGDTYRAFHTFALTVLPDAAGRIALALTPSPICPLAIQRGQFSTNIYDVPAATWINSAFSSDTSPAWGKNTWWGIPITDYQKGNPLLANSPQSQNASTFSSESWRIVKADASVGYIGTTLADSGLISTARQDVHQTDINTYNPTLPAPFYGQGAMQISDVGPTTTSDLSGAKDLAMRRITKGAQLKLMPNGSFGFLPWKDGMLMATDPAATTISAAYCQLGVDASGVAALPVPGLGGADSSYCFIDGMQANQAVMVEVVMCVEHQVNIKSTVRSAAKPSPPADNKALDMVTDMARTLPSSIDAGCDWWCYVKKGLGMMGTAASYAAEAVPYVGPIARGSRAFYSAFASMGGGNALNGVTQYALGYR